MAYFNPPGSPEYRARDLLESHGPAGAVRACESLIAKAEHMAKRCRDGDNTALAHQRKMADRWRRTLESVQERIKPAKEGA